MDNSPEAGHTFAERFARSAPRAAVAAPEPPPAAGAAPPADGGGLVSESYLAGVLYVLAAAAGVLGVLAGLYVLSRAAERGADAAGLLASGAWLIGGLTAAAVLGGLAVALGAVGRLRRQVRQAAEQIERLAVQIDLTMSAAARAADLDRVAGQVAQLAQAVEQVSQDCLLDESARAEKRRQVLLRHREGAVDSIRREMAAGQWDRVAHAIDRFRVNFPEAEELAVRLAEELDRRRQQAENDDIADCRRQCEELMGVAAWDRALALVQQLVAKHPDSTAAKSLCGRVEREHKLAVDEQRRQLYARIQRHTSRRQWKEALDAAAELVRRFPDTVEAEAVKVQMETLSANAEIQHRRQIEEEITDLIKRQRFADAVALSEKVLAEFPDSPQAAALREQLPRLKEKADEQARETRKRRVQWE